MKNSTWTRAAASALQSLSLPDAVQTVAAAKEHIFAGKYRRRAGALRHRVLAHQLGLARRLEHHRLAPVRTAKQVFAREREAGVRVWPGFLALLAEQQPAVDRGILRSFRLGLEGE